MRAYEPHLPHGGGIMDVVDVLLFVELTNDDAQ
jgi:hypothetical protein